MSDYKYYPALADIMTVDQLPDFLGFIKDGLEEAFVKIYFKNYYESKSVSGSSAFYSLDIISRQKLAWELPGTGIFFVINPAYLDSTISSFPVTLFWEWEIMKYIRYFNLNGFSFSQENFFNLALAILNASEEQALQMAIDIFVIPQMPGTTKFGQLVLDINDLYSASISINEADEDRLQQLVEEVGLLDKQVFTTVFLLYLSETDPQEAKEKLNTFFGPFIPGDIQDYIKKLIVPKARVTLELSAAIEFPNAILKPVDDNGEPILDTVTKFIFGEALLYADTVGGIGYQAELAGSLQPPLAAIGNTGLIIGIESLKLDLSKNSNIIEADIDGRSNDFVGIYARAVSVTFPYKWFNPSVEPPSGTSVTTLKLAAYDLLIGTGGVSGTIMLESRPIINEETDFEYYNGVFDFVYPITMFEKDIITDEIIEKPFANYTALKSYLLALGDGAPYQFKFPLALIPEGLTEPLIFENARQYQLYLTTLGDNILWKRIGGDNGFRVGFRSFDLTFNQNVVVESNIAGILEVPKLKFRPDHPDHPNQPIQIEIAGHLNHEGDFNLTASIAEGLKARLFNFVEFNFLTLELGKAGDDFYVGTSVEVTFPTGLIHTMLGDQKIVIPELRFYSDGRFEIIGNNGFLPTSLMLPLGPVDIAVTNIHLGSVQQEHGGVMRKYNYIGFDGAISIDPFSFDAKGQGMKYYYPTDNDEHEAQIDAYLHIQTIEIDIVIPHNTPKYSIHGMLSIPEPGVSQEYGGQVTFKSHQTSISGNASMRLNPRYPAFIVDAEMNLPTRIPLGAMSIYAFRGIIGYRYVAEKRAINLPDDAAWYDYYKAPQKGIHISKFSPPEETGQYGNPFSFGAGLVLGPSIGDGKIVSMRAMLLLSMPSMIALEGRASILSSRLGLTDDREPPFWVFLTWGDHSVEMAIGAHFKQPEDSGDIVEVNAQAHGAYFFNNSSNWYLNIGTVENPNWATFFGGVIPFRARSYIMISSQGIQAGGRLDFSKKLRFGITISISAYVEIGAHLSFERTQFGGYISLGGKVAFRFWGFGFNIYVTTTFSAEAVRPFLIYAVMKFRIRIRLRIATVGVTVRVKLRWEINRHVDMTGIPALTLPNSSEAYAIDRTTELVKGTHMLTNETFELNYSPGIPSVSSIDKFIPLDTFIDIKMVKGLIPNDITQAIGGQTAGATNFTDLIPPKKTIRGHTLRQVKHKYSIKDIEIKAWKDLGEGNGDWVDYHPYVAVVDAADIPLVQNLKIGYWQRSGNQYDAIRILANNPFSYVDAGEPGWFVPEYYGMTAGNLFCHTESDAWHITDVLNKSLDTVYWCWPDGDGYLLNGAFFNLDNAFEAEALPLNNYGNAVQVNAMKVTDVINPHGFAKSLSFNNYNTLAISFEEDVAEVSLKISTDAQSVRITFYKGAAIEGQSFVTFVPIVELTRTQAELANAIVYDFGTEEVAVTKILIEPITPVSDDIAAILEQIEALYTDTYEEGGGVISVSVPSDMALYIQLVTELQALLSVGCNSITSPCANSNRIALYCDLYDLLIAGYPFNGVNVPDSQDLANFFAFLTIIKNYVGAHGDEPTEIYADSQIYEDFWLELSNNFDTWTDAMLIIGTKNLMLSAQNIITILLEKGNCHCQTITSSCTTSFQEVKWKTMAEYEYEFTIPSSDAMQSEQELMAQAIANTIQPIWRPNTAYHIKFALEDNVEDGTNVVPYTYYYGFKTAGPVGHFHNAPGVTYGNEYLYNDPANEILNRKDDNGNIDINGKLTDPDSYALTSLRNYINYERSYPNADGDLIMAKPLFYENWRSRVTIYFIKPMAYHMFQSWPANQDLPALSGALNIIIKDPQSDEVITYPPQESPNIPIVEGTEEGNPWAPESNPVMPMGLTILNNILASDNLTCAPFLPEILVPQSNFYSVALANLKPEKLYTAILNNVFQGNADTEVHKFVFKTSRYANFAAQVNSYILDEEAGRKAVFLMTGAFSSGQIDDALGIVSGENINANTELSGRFLDLFDRVIEGVFKFSPLEAPISTEFNIIRNLTTGANVALLIRNPEPFNNPRINRNDLADTIAIVQSQSSVSNPFAYKVLYSRDYSQAILMHYSGSFNSRSLNVRFKYKVWDGAAYIIETVTVPVSLNPQ